MSEWDNFIGCKIIRAKVMKKCEYERTYSKVVYNDSRDDEYGYCVQYPDGYISWSPSEVFENAYRLIQNSEYDLIS